MLVASRLLETQFTIFEVTAAVDSCGSIGDNRLVSVLRALQDGADRDATVRLQVSIKRARKYRDAQSARCVNFVEAEVSCLLRMLSGPSVGRGMLRFPRRMPRKYEPSKRE